MTSSTSSQATSRQPVHDALHQQPHDSPWSKRSTTLRSTATSILTNVLVSVAIVLVNKHILSTFPYPVLLTAIHQLTCLLVIRVLPSLVFPSATGTWATPPNTPPPPPWRDAFVAGASNVLGLSLMNVSLLANSVLVHQTAKLLGVPMIALVQWLLFGAQPPSRPASLALALVLAGVAIVTAPASSSANHRNSPQQHWGGIVVAGGAVLTTAFSQAALQHMPSFRHVSGLRSVYIMSPYSTVTAFVMSYVIEGHDVLARLSTADHFPWTMLAVSSALAIGANVVGNALIRTTSAITYNVVGHFKTVLIVAGGMVMDRQLTSWEGNASGVRWDKMVGIAVTMVGVALYTRAQQQQGSSSQTESKQLNKGKGKSKSQ